MSGVEIGTVLTIVKYGMMIYHDKFGNKEHKEYQDAERELLEQKSLEPEDRDMRKYDDSLRTIYLYHKRISTLMQEESIKKGLV